MGQTRKGMSAGTAGKAMPRKAKGMGNETRKEKGKGKRKEKGAGAGEGKITVTHKEQDTAISTSTSTSTSTTGSGSVSILNPASTKYPSTPPLPFSPGVNEDDVIASAATASGAAVGDDIVITEKLDGGNCCIKLNPESGKVEVYARTHSKLATHKSFDTVKAMFAGLKWIMTPGLDLYGENMTAVHSIKYPNLTVYFYLFAVKKGETWLGWDDVVEVAESLDIPTVPLKYR